MDAIFILFIAILISFVVLMLFSNKTKRLPLFGVGFILVCITMVLVKVIPANCCASTTMEGFLDPNPTFKTHCPDGTTSYTDSIGNINCCNGTVNGTMCDGTVACTFSSSASGKYPMCGGSSLRRKWFNGIDLWVKQHFMNKDAVLQFQTMILDTMNYFNKNISMFITKFSIPKGAIERFKALLDEENEWFAEAKAEKIKDSIVYQEEVMYVVNELLNIVNTYKLDQAAIQEQLQPKKCSTDSPVTHLMKGRNAGTVTIAKGDYTIEFDITVQSVLAPWTNILHVSTGTDGSRAPGIWLYPNDTKLHVRIGDTTNTNWGLDTDSLPIGQKVHVKLVTQGSNITLAVDKKVYTETQPTKRPTGSGYTVYLSDPWFQPANAIIENLSYILDGTPVKLAN